MNLKDLIELNSSYPAWAKLAFFACAVVAVAILLFAKKTAVEESKPVHEQEARAAKLSEAAKSENRPWIVVESLQLKEPITLRDNYFFLNFIITMKNSGTSTARQVYASIRIATMEVARVNEAWNTVIEDFKRENAARRADKTLQALPFGYVIAPNQGASEPYGCGGPSKEADAPNLQEVRGGAFFVFGYLEYLDQNGGKHHTRFCFIPDGDSVRPWDLATFVPYAGYQDAD